MKILNICTVNLEKNGIATCILNYFEQIASKKYIFDIVAPNLVSKDNKEIISNKNMSLYELPYRKKSPFRYFIELRKLIKRKKYDIVHVHGNSCTIAIELLAAKLAGCKIRIAHSHNTTCEHQKIHKILRPIFEITCNVRFACGEEAGKWLFNDKSFYIIKNGVDLKNYKKNKAIRERIRKLYNINDKTVLLGHVGIFNYQKNHEYLIEIMKILNNKEKGNKYKLICIGEGENQEYIKNIISENKLEQKVILTGNINNVADYLQAIDYFLLPSRYEGVPYVLIEAQAAGVHCLVSENVSREVAVTDLVNFLSLNNLELWIKEIILEKKNIDDYSNKIKQCGFDIVTNAENLKSIYIDLYKKNKSKY